tara:strand:- start:300 stop:416 length:117 start_codon:yes stop_codon:yes gene_type:complete
MANVRMEKPGKDSIWNRYLYDPDLELDDEHGTNRKHVI